jgi:peptide/nickel transport system substrate-binding protein
MDNGKVLKLWSRPNYKQLVTIFYNTKDPILSDENFRLGLSFASPAIQGEEEAFTSIPSTSWAFNKDVKDYLNNPTQAQASLKKVKNGRDTIVVLTATSFLKNVGEAIVSEWNKQGIKSVLRVESGVPQNFQALLITQNIPQDPDQYALWHSTQAQTNISGVSLPRVDKDLEDGRKTSNIETRKARYVDFQKVLLDHSPATFLYFPKFNVVYMKKIEKPLLEVLQLQLPYLYN